jgi:segregation and condensation protein A
VGELNEWTALDRFLLRYLADPEERATVVASSFAATLELIREGRIEVRQDGAFGAIYMRTGANPVTDADIAAMEAGHD